MAAIARSRLKLLRIAAASGTVDSIILGPLPSSRSGGPERVPRRRRWRPVPRAPGSHCAVALTTSCRSGTQVPVGGEKSLQRTDSALAPSTSPGRSVTSSSSPLGPFLSAPRAAAGDRMRFRRRLEQPPKIRTAGSVSELPPNPCFDGQAVEVTLVLDPLDLCLVVGIGLDALRRLLVGREVLEAL